MNKMFKRKSIFIYALFLWAPSITFSAEAGDRLPNIIIITLSGVRNAESINDPGHRLMPNLFLGLVHQGTLYSQVRSNNVAFHMAVDEAMITGRDYEVIDGLKQPSLFQIIRKKYSLKKNKVWALGYWKDKYSMFPSHDYGEDTFPASFSVELKQDNIAAVSDLLDQEDRGYLAGQAALNERSLSKWPIWDTLDQFQRKLFYKILDKHEPVLVHFIMGAPEIAHCNTFTRYIMSLKKCDDVIKKTYEMIRSKAFYKDNTFLVVFPDHGRNEYYQNHNIALNDQYRSWVYVYGPGIAKDVVIDRVVDIKNMYASILNAMRIPLKSGREKRVEERFF